MVKMSRSYWLLITGGLLLLIVISLFVWNMAAPWLANHYGFALPDQGGLPYRIAYGDRNYANLSTCARAGWCHNNATTPLCITKESMQQQGNWPLVQVGLVATLFGSPYSLMVSESSISNHLTIMSVYVVYKTDCYVHYGIEGGP